MTTFSAPQGLLWYKRLIFGAKNAFEDFQEIIEINNTHDIDGVFKLIMILLLMQQL